jgi:hypothetical protein
LDIPTQQDRQESGFQRTQPDCRPEGQQAGFADETSERGIADRVQEEHWQARTTNGRMSELHPIRPELFAANLKPLEFRVFAQISFEAMQNSPNGCRISNKEFAQKCKSSSRKVQLALRSLEVREFITRETVPGFQNCYFCATPENWLPLTELEPITASKTFNSDAPAIEKNVPLPTKGNGHGWTDLAKKMQPGDSIWVNKSISRSGSLLAWLKASTGFTLTTRREGAGMRIWRVQ